jgi:hypothetical protein
VPYQTVTNHYKQDEKAVACAGGGGNLSEMLNRPASGYRGLKDLRSKRLAGHWQLFWRQCPAQELVRQVLCGAIGQARAVITIDIQVRMPCGSRRLMYP